MKRETPLTKMKFFEDKNNPTKEKKSMRQISSLSELIPTKNGIYKPMTAKPTESKPKKKRKGKKRSGFSLGTVNKRGGAKWAMRKTVRRSQRGKSPINPWRKHK